MDREDSIITFVNGIIAGAGALVAIMSFMFMQLVSGLEGVMGVTTTEMRAAIILGALVSAAAIGYEFYRKKPAKKDRVGIEEDGKTQVQTENESQG